jgi:hypothetical protein
MNKWLYKDQYAALVASGRIQGHHGSPSGIIRSNYWPEQEGLKPEEGAGNNHENQAPSSIQKENFDTTRENIETLKMLWIKEHTSWDTTEVLGEHRKQVKLFSTGYRGKLNC